MKNQIILEDAMENLRKEMINQISKNDYTLTQYSIICDISCENLQKIISKKSKDIKLSTLLKICKNSNIELEKIFDYSNEPDEVYVIIKDKKYICKKY